MKRMCFSRVLARPYSVGTRGNPAVTEAIVRRKLKVGLVNQRKLNYQLSVLFQENDLSELRHQQKLHAQSVEQLKHIRHQLRRLEKLNDDEFRQKE